MVTVAVTGQAISMAVVVVTYTLSVMDTAVIMALEAVMGVAHIASESGSKMGTASETEMVPVLEMESVIGTRSHIW
jgi:hypothetical protein